MEFLSDAWMAAMDEAAGAEPSLAAAAAEVTLTIGQEVTGGPDGDVRWHVALAEGRATVRPGPAADPTIWFRQDHATAVAIGTGAMSAQRAFMTGRLRVGGDLQVLVRHAAALAQLDDAFAGVRAATTYPPPTRDERA